MADVFEQDVLETCDGLDLYCEYFPSKSSSGTIIVAHGFGEHSGIYHHFARQVQGFGYGVCLYDMRGHGKSPGDRGDLGALEAALDDLDLLVARVQGRVGRRPLYLLGHNVGASLAALYALNSRPKLGGLVLSHIPFEIESTVVHRTLKPLLKVLPTMASVNTPQNFGDLNVSKDTLVHRQALPLVSAIELDMGHCFLQAHAGDLSYKLLVLGSPKAGSASSQFLDSVISFEKEYWSDVSHPTSLFIGNRFANWLEQSEMKETSYGAVDLEVEEESY